MQRYFIKLSYNGTPFNGWQIQPDAPTVQQELEDAISKIFQSKTGVLGCGRTDSGVHASEFFAHFETEETFEEESLAFKLNCMISNEIAIEKIVKVAEELHARFSATARTYHYYINQKKNAFRFNESWFMHSKLDVVLMNEACQFLIGKQDFTSFSKLHTQTRTNICTITEAYWSANNGNLKFTITADRFLHNMVRAIVGTTISVGKGRMNPDEIKTIIAAKSRQKAGASVPAQGLFLARIKYPQEI